MHRQKIAKVLKTLHPHDCACVFCHAVMRYLVHKITSLPSAVVLGITHTLATFCTLIALPDQRSISPMAIPIIFGASLSFSIASYSIIIIQKKKNNTNFNRISSANP